MNVFNKLFENNIYIHLLNQTEYYGFRKSHTFKTNLGIYK